MRALGDLTRVAQANRTRWSCTRSPLINHEPLIAKAVIPIASVGMVAFECPHGRRSRGGQGRAELQRSARGRPADVRMDGVPPSVDLGGVPFFSFAEHRFVPGRSAPESCASQGLWFHRSHSDLPLVVTPNRARTIDSSRKGSIAMSVIHAQHSSWVYRPGAHPSNRVAGASYLVAFGILRASYRCRRKDDARGIRRRIRGLWQGRSCRTRIWDRANAAWGLLTVSRGLVGRFLFAPRQACPS
jgi:hypothetical protein